MRGEHPTVHGDMLLYGGSSPHARGAQGGDDVAHRNAGIIPACAGSTLLVSATPCRARDHPKPARLSSRSDGDPVSRPGSSPHARGARDLVAGRADRVRIIPACAGSTATCTSSTWPGRDHPRMRGEHVYVPSPPRPQVGSSPHARGALVLACYKIKAIGIIPACAGSTIVRVKPYTKQGDHPRMRGEHCAVTLALIAAVGSSPHARGARAGYGARP